MKRQNTWATALLLLGMAGACSAATVSEQYQDYAIHASAGNDIGLIARVDTGGNWSKESASQWQGMGARMRDVRGMPSHFPLPSAVWLVASGLVGLAVVARRRSRH